MSDLPLPSREQLADQAQPDAEEIKRLCRIAREYIDPAEIQRRKASGGPYFTTAEVLAYLKSLEEKDGCGS